MDRLIQWHKNITNLLRNWDKIVNDFILKQEPLFIDTVHEQLSKGQGGDGGRLESYSSDEYSKFKKAIGSLSSPIADLKLTGDFYEGMHMKQDLEIFSTDWKNDLLKQMYGNDIMEIQDSNMSKIIKDQILPEFEALIRSKIFV